MNPTVEQQEIRDYIATHPKESIIIDAKAGSGKTSTITWLANEGLFPSDTRLVAFNKAIAEELSIRMQESGLKTSTFHSLGLEIVRGLLGKVQCNNYKYADLVRNHFKWGAAYASYKDMIEHILTDGFPLDVNYKKDAQEWKSQAHDLMLQYDVELPKEVSLEEFLERVMKLYAKGIEDHSEVTFAEMLFLPLWLKQKFKLTLTMTSLLVVDEAQDVSNVRLRLMQAVSKQVIAVGDPYQAIYGFAGAKFGALGQIKSIYNAHSLPLSVSFRCAEEIMVEARRLIGNKIFALPTAAKGQVFSEDFHTANILDLDDRSAILCRTNAPLFKIALRMLTAGVRFQMRSDFPEVLVKLVKKLAKADASLLTLRQALRDWIEMQYELLEGKPGLLAKAQDKHDCVVAVLDRCEGETVADVCFDIDCLIRAVDGVVLSTIHKSKGLEWENVFLVRPDLLPAPWIPDADRENLKQELHLEYVAVTRAKFNFCRLVGKF